MSASPAVSLSARLAGAARRAALGSARRLAWRLGLVVLAAGGRVAYGLFAGAAEADAADEPGAPRAAAAGATAGAAPRVATEATAGATPAAARAAAVAVPAAHVAAGADRPTAARGGAERGAADHTDPEPAAAEPAAADRADADRGAPDTVVLEREVFGYAGGGRRDPFRPLIVTTVLRPFPSELRLVGVAYDAAGANSVAILRDVTTKAQHRVRPGQLVGRMRVVRIQPKAVVFAVEELGFSRRETLTLQDSLGTRQP